MAKRQQQADFLPTKALQPQQQIFDQYNAPKQFQAPQSELMEIGSALAGLSPTLQKFEERDRAEDAAAMELAASKMSIDELRAASKRDFIGLQKSGAIPEGASPWAKVALLEAAGKRLVSQTVLPELYKNLDRLSDPNNNESPEQFARSIMDKQGIDSLYAANAAEQALQPVIAQFSNRVGESKAKRTATQNRDDLTDSIYEISQTFQLGKPSEQDAVIAKLQEQLDNAHTNLGISGRNEAWSGISEAAKEMTRNGNYEGAMELLDSVGAMTVGGRAFGKDFAADIDELEDDLETISLQEEDLEFKRDNQRRTTRNRTISDVAGDLVFKKSQEGKLLDDPVSMMSEIETMLTEQGVDDGDIPSMTAEVMKQYRTFQPLGEETDDEDTVAALSNMLLDDSMSYETFASNVETAIISGDVKASTGFRLKANGKKTKDEISLRNDLKRQTHTTYASGLSSINDQISADSGAMTSIDPAQAFAITDDFETQYSAIVRRVTADTTLDQTEKIDVIKSEVKQLTLQAIETIKTGKVTEDTTDVQRETTEARKATALEDSARPEALKAETTFTVWDSEFTNVQEDFQAIANDTSLTEQEQVEKQQELSGRLYGLAKERATTPLKVFRQEPDFGFIPGDRYSWVKPSDLKDRVRAKAITGFSIEEIQNKKLSGDTYKANEIFPSRLEITEEGGGQDIPVELLNPKFVVLVEGMDTVEQFEDWRVTDAGKEALTAIYEAMPTQYQVGIGNFVDLQRDLLRKYR